MSGQGVALGFAVGDVVERGIDDQFWFKCRIVRFDSDGEHCDVQYIDDEGNTENGVHIEELRRVEDHDASGKGEEGKKAAITLVSEKSRLVAGDTCERGIDDQYWFKCKIIRVNLDGKHCDVQYIDDEQNIEENVPMEDLKAVQEPQSPQAKNDFKMGRKGQPSDDLLKNEEKGEEESLKCNSKPNPEEQNQGGDSQVADTTAPSEMKPKKRGIAEEVEFLAKSMQELTADLNRISEEMKTTIAEKRNIEASISTLTSDMVVVRKNEEKAQTDLQDAQKNLAKAQLAAEYALLGFTDSRTAVRIPGERNMALEAAFLSLESYFPSSLHAPSSSSSSSSQHVCPPVKKEVVGNIDGIVSGTSNEENKDEDQPAPTLNSKVGDEEDEEEEEEKEISDSKSHENDIRISAPQAQKKSHGGDTNTEWGAKEAIGQLVKEAACELEENSVAICDTFVQTWFASCIRTDIKKLDSQGKLKSGQLGGGRTGGNLKYEMKKVRGDRVGWFSGKEAGCENIRALITLIDYFVYLLAQRLKELGESHLERQEAMVTCYPGGGARYIKHCDNPNDNGRVLTCVFYCNVGWEEGSGGQLRVHSEDGKFRDIEPLPGRLVVFFSDKRVPHEVIPCERHRYAVTVWYLDGLRRQHALSDANPDREGRERQRLQKEIRDFKLKYTD